MKVFGGEFTGQRSFFLSANEGVTLPYEAACLGFICFTFPLYLRFAMRRWGGSARPFSSAFALTLILFFFQNVQPILRSTLSRLNRTPSRSARIGHASLEGNSLGQDFGAAALEDLLSALDIRVLSPLAPYLPCLSTRCGLDPPRRWHYVPKACPWW